MINDKFNLKPCPLCGSEPDIVFAADIMGDQRIVIECPKCGLTLDHTQRYYTTEKYDKKTGMRTVENTGVTDSESAIDIWNRRTPYLGNEGELLWDDMFPKCKECPSRPSDYSNILCMCNEGMCIPRYPQEDHFEFKFGPYEGEE